MTTTRKQRNTWPGRLAGMVMICGACAVAAEVPEVETGAELPVVEAGTARAVIVVNTAGGRVTALAVEELRDHIEALTGVRLSVVPAAEWKDEAGTTALVVGAGDLLATLGVDLGEVPREGFRQVALPARRVFVLAGRDKGDPLATKASYRVWQEFGTLYAVYDLLEHWGVRWLFPGELGTIVPRRASLTVPTIDRTDGPDFTMRNHWPRGVTPDGAVVGRPDLTSDDAVRRQAAREAVLWALRNRAGNSEETYRGGHHAPRWWDLWAKSHPEYLGLYRGQRGVRRSPPGEQPDKLAFRSKLCVGNPAVAEAVAELAIAAFRASPSLMGYSICEQDGSPGFCACPLCTALDPPPGPGEPVESDTASLTDRYVVFWNRVAERVAAVCPGRAVSAYAYSRYSDLPRRETELHPALKIIFAFNGQVEPEALRRRIGGWSALSPNPIALYTHPMLGAWPVQDYSGSDFPSLTLEAVREGLQFCREKQVVGFITDAGHFGANTVGSHGVLGYAYARWLWDADRPAAEILADFTRHAFGAAAETMLRIFEAIGARQAATPRVDGHAAWLEHHLQVFTPEFTGDLLARFDRALGEATGEADRRRVKLFRENLVCTVAELDLERVWRRFEAGATTIDPVIGAYRRCEAVHAGLPPESRPLKPMFRQGNAARAAALGARFEVLGVLPVEGWEARADPYGEGIEQGWARPGNAGDWRPVAMQGYDAQGFWGADLRVWYRLQFKAPTATAGRLFLGFKAQNTSADIFMNGVRIGRQVLGEAGYAEPELDGEGNLVAAPSEPDQGAFAYALGEGLRPGEVNTLVVRLWGYTDRGVICDRGWLLRQL